MTDQNNNGKIAEKYKQKVLKLYEKIETDNLTDNIIAC